MPRSISVLPAGAVAGAAPIAQAAGSGSDSVEAMRFDRVSTYPVFENRPAGTDAATPTAAEISAVTGDGKTVVYTASPGKRIGFVDISNPGKSGWPGNSFAGRAG